VLVSCPERSGGGRPAGRGWSRSRRTGFVSEGIAHFARKCQPPVFSYAMSGHCPVCVAGQGAAASRWRETAGGGGGPCFFGTTFADIDATMGAAISDRPRTGWLHREALRISEYEDRWRRCDLELKIINPAKLWMVDGCAFRLDSVRFRQAGALVPRPLVRRQPRESRRSCHVPFHLSHRLFR